MFASFVCCLKGRWVHPYTITPTNFPPHLGIQGHLWSIKKMSQNHGWGLNTPQTASYIHIRHMHSVWVWAIGMLSQGHMGAPLFHYHYTGQVATRFGDSASLEEWKRCHDIMVEADIHFSPLHTSIFDSLKHQVCWLKRIWVHPYTVNNIPWVNNSWLSGLAILLSATALCGLIWEVMSPMSILRPYSWPCFFAISHAIALENLKGTFQAPQLHC